MSEHTPGPWNIAQADDFQPFAILAGTTPHRAIICRYSEWRDAREESEANANLIAAAPDLLAACDAAEVYFRGSILNTSESAIVAILRTAIKKARGQ